MTTAADIADGFDVAGSIATSLSSAPDPVVAGVALVTAAAMKIAAELARAQGKSPAEIVAHITRAGDIAAEITAQDVSIDQALADRFPK